jgi:hypothetical protein
MVSRQAVERRAVTRQEQVMLVVVVSRGEMRRRPLVGGARWQFQLA